jgi:hypothetical protein
VAPLGARLAPIICQALGTLAIVLVVASNVDGLSDGIGPASVPLAIAVGSSAAWAIGALLVSCVWPFSRRRCPAAYQ